MKDQESCDEYLKNLNPSFKRLSENDETFIREKVSRLPREERLATYLYFWEDTSVHRISEILQVPTQTVDKLINNALVRLGSELQCLIEKRNSKISMGVAA